MYFTERSSGMCEVDGEWDGGHCRAQLHQRISQSDPLRCSLRTGDSHRVFKSSPHKLCSSYGLDSLWMRWCLSAGEGLAVVASVHAGAGHLSGWSWPERKHSRPRSSSVWTPDLYPGVWCVKDPGPLETAEGSTDIISPVCFLLANLPHSLNIDSIYNIFRSDN